MSDYWQVIRRRVDGGHESIKDYATVASAKTDADAWNHIYQTNEYAVIHRTSEKFAVSMSRFWNDKKKATQ